MTRKKVFQFSVLFMLIGLACIKLFYRLGASGIFSVDESVYGVNTCEMFHSGNWLVPTLYYEIDYASKPPLALWLDLICYSMFGVNPFALRLTSAVSGLLILLVISFYLYKKYGIMQAIIAAASFSTLKTCFDFHMFRSGDMDSLFCLFFVIAVIALREVNEGQSKMIILYAAYVGLGFMTKSMHVVFFAVIGVLYLPVIFRKLKLLDVLIAALAGLLPTAIWLALRYSVDGFRFVNAIAFGEIGDKVNKGFTLEYLKAMLKEKTMWVLFFVLGARIILYFVKNNSGLSRKKILEDIISFAKERYLSILAFAVPAAMYSAAGKYYSWYIYPTYIATIWIIAIEAGDIINKIELKTLRTVFAYGLVIICATYSIAQLPEYEKMGQGGGAIDQYRDNITECLSGLNGEYDGYQVYIAKDRDRGYGDRGHWELEYVFYAESMADWKCMEGGVEGFLSNPDSLLVLDSELWDEYEDELTGYVFLEMNEFFVMCHDRYW